MINRVDLAVIMPQAKAANIERFWAHLNSAMEEFLINSPARQAAFLAQIGHESGQLRYVEELASGQDYDIGNKARRLGNTPQDDDDGERYKGRGLIQITGTDNYRACGEALGLDLLTNPELLELPENACRSAAWFWWSRGLNQLADGGNFERITRKINGGLTGQADRLVLWQRAKEQLT